MNNSLSNSLLVVLAGFFLGSGLNASEMEVGEKTYQQACAMCHATGVAAAPILGKKDDWSERAKKDTAELYNSVINGLGAMPAKGGQVQLSDADVSAAVDYMLEALEKPVDDSAKDASKSQPAVILNAEQEKGKTLAFDRKKGNCLACHQIMDADFPGNSAPILNNMKLRFPDRQVLKSQIADATLKNSNSIMPPFGRHQILSQQELELVTDFIHAL
jgi:sulfur-oxidizing protein SoxX